MTTDKDRDEAKRFVDKMEWEGGIVGLLEYGGPTEFPDEVIALAEEVQYALTKLERAIDEYLDKCGVSWDQ